MCPRAHTVTLCSGTYNLFFFTTVRIAYFWTYIINMMCDDAHTNYKESYMSYELDKGFVVVDTNTEKRYVFGTIEETAAHFGVEVSDVENHLNRFPMLPYMNSCTVRKFDRSAENKAAVRIASALDRDKPKYIPKRTKNWSKFYTKPTEDDTPGPNKDSLLIDILNNLPDDTRLIEGYSYHTISLNGEVINHKTRNVMSSRLTDKGYVVGISEPGGKSSTCMLRRLIAKAFVPNPEGHRYCLFDDNSPESISIEGARWVSCKEYRSSVPGYHMPKNRDGAYLGEAAVKALMESLPEGTARLPYSRYHTITTEGVVTDLRYGKVIKHCTTTKGYPCVPVRECNEYHLVSLHRALAECFIPNPYGHKKVIHIDGDKSNISLDNLVWSKSLKWFLDGRDNLRK